MRLIVIRINEDVINGGALSIMVGIFDSTGVKQMEFNVPRHNLIQQFGDIKVGQEVKLIPAEVTSKLLAL
jgi:hypothetical protein